MSDKGKKPNPNASKKPVEEVQDAELDQIGGGLSLNFTKTFSPSDRTSPSDKLKRRFSPIDESISPSDLPSFSPSDTPSGRR